MSVDDAQRYMAEGHFPPGSMGPKATASIRFLQGGGEAVIITSPTALGAALAGKTGTWIAADTVRY